MKPLILDDVSSSLGAPMGRINQLPDDVNERCELLMTRLKWVDGDYDNGGAYWGGGAGEFIYCAYGDVGDIQARVYVRSKRFSDAVNLVREILPNASIKRGYESTRDLGEDADEFLLSYIDTALDCEIDDSDRPLSVNYGSSSLSDECRQEMIADCKRFLEENKADIGNALKEAGHDFFLTRNRHGAGFWDGDWESDVGDRLTKAAHSFGEFHLYVGDDGMIYC